MECSYDIKITGIVQGVGFRPFVCKLANKYNILGWVLNDSSGVLIHAESTNEIFIKDFIYQVKNNPPPLAIIIKFLITDSTFNHYKDFSIKESHKTSEPTIFISPDVCTCEDCKNDILTPNNKRYYYPFTNCTNCGPRFSIIKEVPYDRKYTTMREFEQCSNCKTEYTDIANRRFHAQPNCCPNCGPSLSILNSEGFDITTSITNETDFNSSDYNKLIIKFFKKEILKGKIWAIKSLSGFHLCCLPTEYEIVKLLRDRKNRPNKPLAIMMKDIETVKKYCYLSKLEEKMLLSKARPIVLLQKKYKDYFPENIAPNNNLLGVMLPSNPLHILIMEDSPFDSLVMTSGNLSGLPLEFQNENAINHLSKFVDFFLTNNRDIVLPLDDSIMRENLNKETFIRKSRGFVPLPISYENAGDILALGGDMKNTFAVSKKDFIYIGPHNGNLENYEIINRLKENISRYLRIFECNPKLIACDLHPNYETTSIAKSFNLPLVQVQHHHAHIASCMVDNEFKDKVIGIAFDGTGYGDDNAIWGSEFFICDLNNYKRVGHLEYINFLGGDSTIRDGDKLALSYLHPILNETDAEKIINKYYKGNYEIIFKLLKHSKFSYKSSSMGRLFDAIASLLGLCQHSSYEGEAAIALESIVENLDLIEGYNFKIINKNDIYELSPTEIIRNILVDINNGLSPQIISQKFHSTIVNYVIEMCILLREKYSINTVALSGGVFQNNFLITNCYNKLIEQNFNVLTHNQIPTNDGGISIGQLAIANVKALQ